MPIPLSTQSQIFQQFAQGELSAGAASERLNMNRYAFYELCVQNNIPTTHDAGELAEELALCMELLRQDKDLNK